MTDKMRVKEKQFYHAGLYCFIYEYKAHKNGYVAVGKDHPLYGVNYDNAAHISVHGGLTYSGYEDELWVFGFDTIHLGDYWAQEYLSNEAKELIKKYPYLDKSEFSYSEYATRWTNDKIRREVEHLAEQLAAIKETGN